MDLNGVYALALGSVSCIFILANVLPLLVRLGQYLSPLISKHMVYRDLLQRHRLFGPWSRAGVLLQLIYIAGNIVCAVLGTSHGSIQLSPISQVGLRAGTLSLINLIALFAGPHLDFWADVLGVASRTLRHLHSSAGVMAVLLALFHTLVVVGARPSFGLKEAQNLFAVIVSVESPTHSVVTNPQDREFRVWDAFSCFLFLSFDDLTSSSFAHITSCRRSPSTLSGDTYLGTNLWPAIHCTLWRDCFWRLPSSNLASSSTIRVSFDLVMRMPISATNMVPSDSESTARSRLKSKLDSISICGYPLSTFVRSSKATPL